MRTGKKQRIQCLPDSPHYALTSYVDWIRLAESDSCIAVLSVNNFIFILPANIKQFVIFVNKVKSKQIAKFYLGS
jgi:hypothetical protein